MNNHIERRWLARQVIGKHQNRAMKNQEDTITWELVWGYREKESKVIGDAYHCLSGPTAHASIASYAEDLNMRNVPPSKMPKCMADGPVRTPKNDPNQLGLFLMLTPSFQSA